MSRIEAHDENKRRLARRREEKEAERCRETVMARKYFWLTMLWSSAAQELLAQVRELSTNRSAYTLNTNSSIFNKGLVVVLKSVCCAEISRSAPVDSFNVPLCRAL